MKIIGTMPFLMGPWRVDPACDEISRDGTTVKLEPRTMRVLMCLAERDGDIVSVNELLDTVWKDLVVTQYSVYQAVAVLRRALGDDPKDPTYIASVSRRGYRLVAPVVPAEPEQITASPHRESAPLVGAAGPQHPELIETAHGSHDPLAAVQAAVGPDRRLGPRGRDGGGPRRPR